MASAAGMRLFWARFLIRFKSMGSIFSLAAHRESRRIKRTRKWYAANSKLELETKQPEDLQGWQPLFADLATQTVLWAELGSLTFTEPVLQESISWALAEADPAPRAVCTPIDVLKNFQADATVLQPSGFIFQMSRCGSTLIKNMLASLPGNLVISEPGLLTSVSSLYHQAGSEEESIALLKGVMNALGQSQNANQKRFFIKLASRQTILIPLLRKVFPDVPWVYLYRHPVEVAVSNCLDPAGWLLGKDRDPQGPFLSGASMEVIRSYSQEEYCARVLGNFCRIALEAADEKTLLVDHRELNESFPARLASFFQLDASAGEVAIMAKQLKNYSKDPKKQFKNDHEQKRKMATPALLQAVDDWAMDPFQQLSEVKK